MKRRTSILIGVGFVILFALAFVVISASPRRRIAPGSIVLLDKSPGEPVKWMAFSNTTDRTILVHIVCVQREPKSLKLLNLYADTQLNLFLQPHTSDRADLRNLPTIPYELMIIAADKLKGVERTLSAARKWFRTVWRFRALPTSAGNPFATNHLHWGHDVNIAPELLNVSSNRVLQGAN